MNNLIFNIKNAVRKLRIKLELL